MFYKKHFKSLNPNEVKVISTAIIIFKKNKVIVVILKNKKNIDNPPTKLPIIILNIFVCLFKISDTDKRSRKSKNIFKINIKSTYIFIVSPVI